MLLAHLLIGWLLSLLPRALLQRRLAACGPGGAAGAAGGPLRCLPCFSGRTALELVAQAFEPERRTLLLPAYLCNVVALAFERQGWTLVGYEVDEDFQPDNAALLARAADCGASAVLLAPLYGSDGGLRWWLAPAVAQQCRQQRLALVLDLCQDAAWLREVPAGWQGGAVVLSFNDKSFPGAMGAVLWTDLPCDEPPAPGPAVALRLLGWRLRVLLGSLRRGASAAEGFEYSQATQFPHDFSIPGATRWQLALGLLGLRGLARWQQRRRAALQRGDVKPAGPSVGSSSPYVLVAADDPGRHRRKSPYAVADAPTQSLRPALQVRHNKGFDDR